MPTDDDVTGLYASDSGDERRNGGLLEKLGSGIVWNEFHMPTEHKNRISERARFLSHRPKVTVSRAAVATMGCLIRCPIPLIHRTTLSALARNRATSLAPKVLTASRAAPQARPAPQRPIALPIAKLIPLVIDRVQIRTYPRHLSSSLSSPV